MRDNGIPEARGQDGLDWFAGLAREALGRLVSVRDQQGVKSSKSIWTCSWSFWPATVPSIPAVLLDAMLALHLDPEMVACGYRRRSGAVAGRKLAVRRDELCRRHDADRAAARLVRRVDEMVDVGNQPNGPLGPDPGAEAEQHTLGAFVLALQMRLAGFSAVVRVAPVAADLTVLLAANRFDLALVSIGCTAGLNSGIGLVRTLRLMSRGDMRIYRRRGGPRVG